MAFMKEKTFVRSFLHWYQLGAVIFVVIIALAIGFAFRYSVMMQLEDITQNNNITAGYLISNHIYENHQAELDQLSSRGVDPNVQRVMDFSNLNAHMLSVMPSINVLLIKLYNDQGTLVFATSGLPALGEDDTSTALQQALEGTISTELTAPDDAVDRESPLSGKFYAETYLPVYAGHEGQEIVAVLELYLDVSEQIAGFRSVMVIFALIVVLIVFLMYLWGRFLISPAERLMRLQHARQQKLRAAIEKAPIGIILANGSPEKNKITYANGAAGQLLKKAPKTFMGRSISDVITEMESVGTSHYSTQANSAFTSITQVKPKHKTGMSARWLELIVGAGAFKDSSDNDRPFVITIVSDIDDRKQSEARQALLSEVVEKSINAIEVLDQEGRFEYANKAAESLHGVKGADIIGHTPESMAWLGDNPDDLYRQVDKAITSGLTANGTFTSKNAQGGTTWLESSVFRIPGTDLKDSKTVVIQRDITDQLSERFESQKLSLAVEQSTSMIMITNCAGEIDYVNPSFVARSGYTQEEALGKNPRILQSGLTPTSQYKDLWKHLNLGKPWQGEMLNKSKNGEPYWVNQSISALRDAQGKVTHFVAILEDITVQKEAIDRLNFLAMHDDLTQLNNRVAFNQRLEFLLDFSAEMRPQCAVLLINVDRFKEVNSDLGHEMGDKVLVEIGRRLTTVCSRQDLVARLNGDEFGVISTQVSGQNGVSDLASALIAAVAQPIIIEGISVRASISIGVEMFAQDIEDIDTILRHAELALYSKTLRTGGEYFFFQKEMDEEVARYRSLVVDMKDALEQGAFILHYQPVVHQPTGKIRSMEALLRWQHPYRGWISPVEFIPIAEQTNLIVPLGAWVVREACLQIKRWSEQGWDIPIAVNLSIIQFRGGQLHLDVERIIKETGIEPQLLHLEITESVAIGATEDVLPSLHYFHDLGIEILLDDFGTGYSSLSQLRSLPIDRLKIDRSFLKDIQEDSIDDRVIKAIIELGKSLDKHVTVEGVETEFQKQVMVDLGCVDFQGYYYFKPMSEADATNVLLAQM